MFVYANLLGTWQKLPDNATINDLSADYFAKDFVGSLRLDKDCYEIAIPNKDGKKDYYYVHKSCIQVNFVK